MINNVTPRFFADPLLDLKENKSTLIFGTTSNKETPINISQDVLEKIRSQIIHLNLTSKGSLKTLEKPVIIERTVKPPFWNSLKSVFNRLQKKDLEHIAKIVVFVAMTVFFVVFTKYLTTSAIKNYAAMKAGNLFWYRLDDYNLQFPIRAYNMGDFITEDLWPLFSFAFLTLVSTFISYEEVVKFKNSIKPLIGEIKKAYSDPFIITQKIKMLPSPIAGKEKDLINARDGDAYIDPVSKKRMSPKDLSKPTTILLGDQVLTIESLLKTLIFSDLDSYTKRLKHPFEERLLTIEEQDSILEQLAAFYCIDDKEQLLNCWKLPDDINKHVDHQLKQFLKALPINPLEILPKHTLISTLVANRACRKIELKKLIPPEYLPKSLETTLRLKRNQLIKELDHLLVKGDEWAIVLPQED